MAPHQTPVVFRIGERTEDVLVPNLLAQVVPSPAPGVPCARQAVEQALDHPNGTPPLLEMARGRRNAVILVNDNTRPYPAWLLVRGVAERLNQAGIPDERILLLVATGMHVPNTRDEQIAAYGSEMVERFRIVPHDALDEANLKFVGRTERGMDVVLNRLFLEADLKISTGLIAPHHSAGFSGGRKSVLPGICGLQTLRVHHSLPIRPFEVSMGVLDGNPFHEEALRAARMGGLEFIVNVVVNRDKEVSAVVAGDVDAAHRQGAELCRAIWEVTIPAKADVVITCPGGYPRDMDLRQAQKAISSAEHMCRPGGTIILCAEARGGIGPFGEYLKRAVTPEEVIEEYRRDGFNADSNSKAFHFARALSRFRVVVAGSQLAEAELQSMFMSGAATVQEAVDAALAHHGPDATFLAVPVGYGLIVRPCAS